MIHLEKFDSFEDEDESPYTLITRDDFSYANSPKSKIKLKQYFDVDDVYHILDWCKENNKTVTFHDTLHKTRDIETDESWVDKIHKIAIKKDRFRKNFSKLDLWIVIYPMPDFFYILMDGVPNPNCQYWVIDNVVNLINYLEDSFI
jgi:hypothetical protein